MSLNVDHYERIRHDVDGPLTGHRIRGFEGWRP